MAMKTGSVPVLGEPPGPGKAQMWFGGTAESYHPEEEVDGFFPLWERPPLGFPKDLWEHLMPLCCHGKTVLPLWAI